MSDATTFQWHTKHADLIGMVQISDARGRGLTLGPALMTSLFPNPVRSTYLVTKRAIHLCHKDFTPSFTWGKYKSFLYCPSIHQTVIMKWLVAWIKKLELTLETLGILNLVRISMEANKKCDPRVRTSLPPFYSDYKCLLFS
ncbi:hypothetical protein MLD38_021542 [Melastoma candidum]|uniref:Uncharacterized protein n=1 Tax=Melastoma candidum TaxID=119954 RepID=A0ACB9QHD4_9MYRT|nr:hypothetical protein MLD38_021542 [Melastoma candidum]